jgi:hypothetical protein
MKYLEEFADKIQHLTEHTTVNDLRDTFLGQYILRTRVKYRKLEAFKLNRER